MNNILKCFTNLFLYIALAFVLAVVLEFGFSYLFERNFDFIYFIAVTLVGVTYFVRKTIDGLSINLNGNEILMSNNLFFPKTDGDGHTIYNTYGPSGWHVLLPWETMEDIQTLETEIVDVFTFEVTVSNAVLLVEVQWSVIPDPHELSIYFTNGKDAKERKENITEKGRIVIKRQVEIALSRYKRSTIFQNRKVGILTIQEKVETALNSVFPEKCKSMGTLQKSIELGDINDTEETRKALNDGFVAEQRVEAMKKFSKALGGDKPTDEQTALAGKFAMAEAGQDVRFFELNVAGLPKDLRDVTITPGVVPGSTGSSKTSTKKESK
jgi:hypothetical protein